MDMERPAIDFIIQIGNEYLNELLLVWLYYEQPCRLLFIKPKTEGLTAVKLTVASDEAAVFVQKAMERTGCKLYKAK